MPEARVQPINRRLTWSQIISHPLILQCIMMNGLGRGHLKNVAGCCYQLLYQGFDFHRGCARNSFTSVLQHQICNFHIKYGMSHIETTYVPSLHLIMSATIQYIQR